jgi:hypothetical protein
MENESQAVPMGTNGISEEDTKLVVIASVREELHQAIAHFAQIIARLEAFQTEGAVKQARDGFEMFRQAGFNQCRVMVDPLVTALDQLLDLAAMQLTIRDERNSQALKQAEQALSEWRQFVSAQSNQAAQGQEV